MNLGQFILLLALFSITSCGPAEETNNDHSVSFEDSVLNSKKFILDYAELPSECSKIISEKASLFYTADNSNDTIYKVYSITSDLFPEHYSKDESLFIEKFGLFVKKEDTTELLFCGIDRRISDFLFLSELDVGRSNPVLTKEEHFRWSTDFSELEKNGCIQFDFVNGYEHSDENYRNIGTFEHNSEYLWVIDSIQLSNSNASIFSGIDTFHVENNNTIISKKQPISYYFADWLIYFVNESDTVPARIVSYAMKARIIDEDEVDGARIYMKRL